LQALEVEREHSKNLSLLLDDEKKHSADLYRSLLVERHARQRGQVRKDILEKQIKLLCSADYVKSDQLMDVKSNASKAIEALLKTKNENSNLKNELSMCLERCRKEVKEAQFKVHTMAQNWRQSKMLAAKLQKRCARAIAVKEKAVLRVKNKIIQEKSVHSLSKKGVYTEETRNLVWLLVQAGCSHEYVGHVIHAILKTAGIFVVGQVSRWTVSRIVIEGYYAAQMQLGYEMQNMKGMTFSADGTTHRSINYTSQHVNLQAETYAADGQDTQKIRATRLIGVHSALDGSSQESVKA
jgi:hypothetical protein